jgi:prepilin-type N-terminal cleavage/methylation domain-containing protein
MRGFSLVETMIALVVLAFGLLAAGQLLLVTGSSASLARSKGTAAIAAQSKLESLTALCRRNPFSADLAVGNHGPEESVVVNPSDESVLNNYRVEWDVSSVPDPRPGKVLDAIRVTVRVTPSLPGGKENFRPGMNKILTVGTILGLQ